MEAAAGVAVVWHAAANDSQYAGDPVDPQIEMLWRIADEGFLGEYVLLEELAANDPDVVRHFSRDQLDRLRAYVRRYVIGGVPI
jgi:hypothetical protein